MDVYRPAFKMLTDQIMQRVKAMLQAEAHVASMHLADLGSIDRPPLNLKQRPSDPLEAFYGEISNGITIMPTRLCFDIVLHPQNNVEAYDAEFRKGLMGLINSRHPDHNTIVFAWVHKPLFQHILNSKAQVTGRANVDSVFILGTVPPGFFREKSGQLEVPAQPALPAQPTDEDYAAVAARQVLDELLAPIVSVEKVNPFKYEVLINARHEKPATDPSVWYLTSNGEPVEIKETMPAPYGGITQDALDKVATCAFQEMKRRRREERAKYNECHNSGPTERPYTRQDRIDERGYAIRQAMAAPAEHMTIHTMMRSPPRVMQAWPHEPRVFRRIK